MGCCFNPAPDMHAAAAAAAAVKALGETFLPPGTYLRNKAQDTSALGFSNVF